MAFVPRRRARSAAHPATAVLATLALTASLCTFVGPLPGGPLGSAPLLAAPLAATTSQSRPAEPAEAAAAREGQGFTSPEQVT